MNFVGHAMVAGWEHDEPRFVLGSMLPDFAQMCGARLDRIDDARLAAGVACHHRTDAVFHGLPQFMALCGQARRDLQRSGVSRPTALAAAHVGVELLLDGCWLEDGRVTAGYRAAIEDTQRLPAAALGWVEPGHAERFAGLCARLRAAGPPRAYGDPEEVGHRLVRILARRPRLAARGDDAAHLVAWTRSVRPKVRDQAAALRQALQRGMAARARAE